MRPKSSTSRWGGRASQGAELAPPPRPPAPQRPLPVAGKLMGVELQPENSADVSQALCCF